LIAAATDLPPTERHSAQKQRLPRGGLEKAFAGEFKLHTKP